MPAELNTHLSNYSLDSTIDATNANENATLGANVTAKAENKTPKAPNLRCKLAEPAKDGFAISKISLNVASRLIQSRGEAVQTLLPFRVYIQSIRWQQPDWSVAGVCFCILRSFFTLIANYRATDS